jgi:AcrR family transcriptional regulator
MWTVAMAGSVSGVVVGFATVFYNDVAIPSRGPMEEMDVARPREHDATTAEAMVDAAGRLLRAEGVRALSVRRVAEEVDVSTQALYSLFGGKAGLVRALHRTGFARLAAELDTVATTDPVGRVRDLGLAYHRTARANPHLYDVMFDCPVPEFEPTEEDAAASLATLQVLRDAVAEAIEVGALAGDVDDVTMVLWATVHGVSSLDLAGALGTRAEADRRVALALDAALAGLAD